MSARDLAFDVVIPTIGRPGLARLLSALDTDLGRAGARAAPSKVVVVDDRPRADAPLDLPETAHLSVEVVASGGRGPAAARNRGWRRTTEPWVCFLDDDVIVRPGWFRHLVDDLGAAAEQDLADLGATQGRVHVPMPSDRRPTDRERNVGGLATASWITADMAIRRAAIADVGGFDERFPRAYREDADIALRLMDAGWRLDRGRRAIDHPVGDAPWTASISSQRGNADDALMNRLHGKDWRRRAEAPKGTLRRHLATTATGAGAALCAILGARRCATVLGSAWIALWAQFTWKRVAPGPRTLHEAAAMAVTSAVLPPAAAVWSVRGRARAMRLAPGGRVDQWQTRRPEAVLFDRDGTLIIDVPYNGDPAQVSPVPGARAALDRVRDAGIAVGVVSNQSGVARGMLTVEQVEAVNARVAELLGPFDVVRWCPHGTGDRCRCRKPSAGMVTDAAEALRVRPTACALVGDIGSDVEAALTAGARGVLVANDTTRADEVASAPEVANDLAEAVDALLGGWRLPAGHRVARHAPDREERSSDDQERAS